MSASPIGGVKWPAADSLAVLRCNEIQYTQSMLHFAGDIEDGFLGSATQGGGSLQTTRAAGSKTRAASGFTRCRPGERHASA